MNDNIILFEDIFSPASVKTGNPVGNGKHIDIKLKLKNGLTLKDLGLTKNQAKFLTAILLTMEI